MRKKIKGFTLVELLAVVIILSIILLLAVPSVVGIIYSVKEDNFYNQLTLLTTMGETYLLENNIAFDDNGEAKITLQQLMDAGYAPSYVIDPRCNGYFYTEDTYLTVTLTDNSIIDVSIYAATECGEAGDGDGSYDNSVNGSVGSGSGSTGGTSSGGSSSGGSTGDSSSGSTTTTPPTSGDYVPDIVATSIYLDNGLTPVIWDGSNWKVADMDTEWYNYSNGTWANAVLLKTTVMYEVGTVVVEDDVTGYFVYIPRYKYQVLNATTALTNPSLVEIEFQSIYDEKATGTTTGSWLTHPAFTTESGEEVAGIWVAKFQTTGTTSALTAKPGLAQLTNTSISDFFFGIQAMSTSSNSYGLTTSADAHMIRNTEWGALAYLTHSVYGAYDVYGTKSIEFTPITAVTGTGGSWNTCSSSSYRYRSTLTIRGITVNTGGGNTTTSYQSNLSTSTTGNVTGVFDFYSYYAEATSSLAAKNNGSAGFPDIFLNSSANDDLLQSYPSNTSSTAFNNRILGDATTETRAWYDAMQVFITDTSPWFIRGGYYSLTSLSNFNAAATTFTNCVSTTDAAILAGAARLDVLLADLNDLGTTYNYVGDTLNIFSFQSYSGEAGTAVTTRIVLYP